MATGPNIDQFNQQFAQFQGWLGTLQNQLANDVQSSPFPVPNHITQWAQGYLYPEPAQAGGNAPWNVPEGWDEDQGEEGGEKRGKRDKEDGGKWLDVENPNNQSDKANGQVNSQNTSQLPFFQNMAAGGQGANVPSPNLRQPAPPPGQPSPSPLPNQPAPGMTPANPAPSGFSPTQGQLFPGLVPAPQNPFSTAPQQTANSFPVPQQQGSAGLLRELQPGTQPNPSKML